MVSQVDAGERDHAGQDISQPRSSREPVVEQPQTIWSVIGRFIKGLFGLGSGVKQEIPLGGEEIPAEEFISPGKPAKGG